ncbi:MBL fold metallo-hydrolase [Pseudonocardia sp. TRM90224]|uniref:MBL fold metallo-hydrolase n=1 Tax=Pseudonocardia sp. TRM90224 TaxID=2812678 RepID=UPI001E4D9DD5|nr:MBL fold metallo-hydrolase [Pseudonocardia sp. TRM90224]
MRIGDIDLHPVADGTFVAAPGYFGTHVGADAHPELFDRDGTAWLPIGCFLVRSGDRVVLVDAGMGPQAEDLPLGMRLLGGQLLTGLRALGVTTADITDVICTHLHTDHVGWLFDLAGTPVFPRATIWFGAGDHAHFVDGSGHMVPHIRKGFLQHTSRLRPIDHNRAVAPGITAQLTPGHTPGHLCVVVSSGQERALLLGDAVTCPVQLDEPTWHSLADVDTALADRTRELLWRELEQPGVVGVGAHFPELRFGRLLRGNGRQWHITP